MGQEVGWGGVFGDLQGGSESVSQVDGASDMVPTCQLCGGGFRKWTVASAHLDVRHFSFSLYITGAFQAATPVLKLRGTESEPMCGFFKRNCLGLQQFLSPTQSLLVFEARSCRDLSSWHWSPGLGYGAGTPCS